MNIYLWAVFSVLTILTLIPLLHFDLFQIDRKYNKFKYVSIVLFLWALLSFARYTVTNGPIQYYLSLTTYPLVFLLTLVLFLALLDYLNVMIHSLLKWSLWGFFFLNTIISYTNPLHEWMMKLQPSSSVVYDDFRTVSEGPFFFIHTFLSYSLLIVILILLFKKFYAKLRDNKDYYPFTFLLVGILFGISANVMHVFIYTFTIDPTFVTFVIVTSILYYVFYMRDLKLILAIDRNRFIIDNLREKFVLVDENNHVVDASSEFEQFLEIDLNKHYTFDQLMTEINKKAVVFKEIEELDETLFDDSKLYLNMYEKDIHLPFFKYSGHFYLFYDDTANQKYVHDMHYVKTHDLMTNLYNRNYIEEMRATLNKKDVYYHLIMFDLDGLKLFNDHLGHQSGDALLKRFANLLKQFQSKEIIPIRLGGDEFLMVFIGQDLKVVHKVIEQLQNSNKNKPFIETLHFSYGIASKTKKNESLNHLMSQVDVLMYKSKHAKDNYKEKLQVKLKEFSIHNKK